MHISDLDLDIQDALTLKRAERWLEVGRPALALHEMERLALFSWAHPWADRILDTIWPPPANLKHCDREG
jgi:hypothetical protein